MFRRAFLFGPVLVLALAAAGLLAPAFAEDEPVIGSIEDSRGEVLVMRAEGARIVGPGEQVREMDRIVTGPDGRARVRLADGSTLSVGSDTEILLSKYPGGDAEAGFFDLFIGIVRATLAKQDREPGFEIRARTAVASVRSTDWIVEAKADNTAVFVAEGRVAVTASSGAGEVVLDPGEGTDVPLDGAPKPPVEWGQKRVDDFVARTDVGT